MNYEGLLNKITCVMFKRRQTGNKILCLNKFVDYRIYHKMLYRSFFSGITYCTLWCANTANLLYDYQNIKCVILRYRTTCLRGMTIYKNVNDSSSISFTYCKIGWFKTANLLHDYLNIKCLILRYHITWLSDMTIYKYVNNSSSTSTSTVHIPTCTFSCSENKFL